MNIRKTLKTNGKYSLVYDCESFQYCILKQTNEEHHGIKLWQQVGKWYYTKSYAIKKYKSYLNG
jgi:hypothetical protein